MGDGRGGGRSERDRDRSRLKLNPITAFSISLLPPTPSTHPGAAPQRWSQTIFVAFNPGFGSGNGELMYSWAQDLRLLCERRALVVCTCANDYSDLRGETTLLNTVVGARYVIVPQRCPFQAASCMIDGDNEVLWTAANSCRS